MLKSLNTLLTFLILFCLSAGNVNAQSLPTDIRYGIIEMKALRYHPDATDATQIMQKLFLNIESNSLYDEKIKEYDLYQKTSVDIVIRKESLDRKLSGYQSKNDFVYKVFIHPFESWIKYARPVEKNPSYLALTTFLFEDYKTISENTISQNKSRAQGLYESVGKQNMSRLLDEVFGNLNLFQDESEIMLLKFKSPLGKNSRKIYTYQLVGIKDINGILCYQVTFFCKNMKENAFSGCFYISNDENYSLVEAQFTLNNPSNMNFLQDVLITHQFSSDNGKIIPKKKSCSIILGDNENGCIIANRTSDSQPIPLTPAQSQIGELIKTSTETRTFQVTQNLVYLVMSKHINLGGINGPVEVGPLPQFLSYNDMEGLRLRLGGNTTVKFSDQWLLGGYAAYGFKDRKIKYRTDLMYSFQPKSKHIWEYPNKLLSFTYINDLNIPGEDPLTTDRDDITYSFSHALTNNMSLQKIGLLTFENELTKGFSYKIGGQFKYDSPVGIVRYMQAQGTDTIHTSNISSSELQLSLRFSPGEKFIQSRHSRSYIRNGDVELNFNHNIGIKGIFGSEYNYHKTEIKGYKEFDLWGNSGNLDLYLSGGKIWNRVPFPLLFIPQGNQTYVFSKDGFNCLNFYELVTDNYIAGNLNFSFKWSPVKLFNPKSKIKTTLGARAIYGPLSDNNNPEIHPEIFFFNNGVSPLNNTPYTEVNIGFANILKILRIEYVRRLTYLDNGAKIAGQKTITGSLFFTGSLSF